MNMALESHTVTVEQIPEALNADEERIFLCELRECMNDSRPRVVLDCSKLRQMDEPAIHLLLSCLEEAMKRNGEVRLAGVSPAARTVLAYVGADRLFQFFPSNADAIGSFHQRAGSVGVPKYTRGNGSEISGNAA
jgi:anti-anti-sigma factor